MAGVLAPVRQQVVLLEVAHDRAVDVGARDPRPQGVERDPLGGDRVVEEPAHLVRRRADDQRSLELCVVSADGALVSVTSTSPGSKRMLCAIA